MTPTISRLLVGLLAFALLAAACTSDSAAETVTTTVPTTTTSTTTTTAPTTTTTSSTTTTTSTVPVTEVSDAVNGLPAPDDLIDRRLVAVKVDNHPNARPQSGLEVADAVFEIPVEAGLTRFIALFHQSDLDYVGPNRSGRPTDSEIMSSLGESPFQISGAQPWVQAIFRSDGINVVYDNGATTFRQSARPRPHNLFTSTPLIREWADNVGWEDVAPGNLFTFGDPTPGEATAVRIETPVSQQPAPTWEWDGEQYLRFHGDEPHEWVTLEGYDQAPGEESEGEESDGEEATDAERGQVAFDTIVVMKMRRYTARPSGTGSSVPAMETVGTGDLLVFTDGEVISGTWERGSAEDGFTLVTADGEPLVLEPARIWITLVPTTETVTWE